MDPSPTPKFDNPKMDNCAALQIVRRRPRKTDLCDPAAYVGGVARF